MIKQMMLVMIGISLISFVFAIECQDQTDVEDVPCTVITPAVTCPTGNYNATIEDLNNASKTYTVNMSTLNVSATGVVYNFTFNYSNVSQYYITICENSTASIDVGHWDEDYNDKWLYMYGFTLFGAFVLFFLGVKKQDNYLTLFCGLLIIAFAITFITYGYPGINNQTLNLSVILLSLGTGLYVTGRSAINLVAI